MATKKQKVQEWETKEKKIFARIYKDMMLSEAFVTLTPRQMMLYIVAKMQFYGHRKPAKDYPHIEAFHSEECLYLNHALGVQYGLYPPSNHRDLYRDIEVLIEHGFLERLSNGRVNQKKSVYRFSGNWKKYKKE